MASKNNTFTITDERFEWDADDSPNTLDAEATASDERDTIVGSSERGRTLLIGGEGALVGGLVGAIVASVVVMSSSSGSASPEATGHLEPVHPRSTATVLSPPAPTPDSHSKAATHKSAAPHPGKKPEAKHQHPGGAPHPKHPHTGKGQRKHTPAVATAPIRSRAPKHHSKPTLQPHRSR